MSVPKPTSCPRIVMDMRWVGAHGIGRFAAEVHKRIPSVHALRTRNRLFTPFDPICLSARLSASRADIFFSPGFNAPVWERIPIVLTVHDLNYIYCADNSDALRRLYFSTIVRPACRRAFRVLTVSEFSKKQIMDWAHLAEDDIVNVGVGVDAAFSPQGTRHNPGFPYLLAIGSVRPHKNLYRLIHALTVSGLQRDFKLLIVGRVDPDSAILLKQEKYASAVQLLGHVPDADLPSLYRGATALCMPSLFEGFGLPLLEAMASGVPVLTSNVTSMPEVVGDAGLLVDPRDVDSIAFGLREIVTNATLRHRLVRKGIFRSREYTWDKTAQKISGILYQAVEQRSR